MDYTKTASSGWNPIDTAPRNGAVIIAGVLSPNGWYMPFPMKVRFARRWGIFRGRWVNDADGRAYAPQPTHWAPTDDLLAQLSYARARLRSRQKHSYAAAAG